MNKSIGDKLAASLRQAKGGAAEQTSHQGSGQNTGNTATVAGKPHKPVTKKIAAQNHRPPPPNSVSPWENLHPERIWPD